MIDHLYIAVTPDEYELPMAVCETVAELRQTLKLSSENTIYRAMRDGSLCGGYRIKRVNYEEGDRFEDNEE